MNFEIRRLKLKEIIALSQFFECEKQDPELYIWQDRGTDFLKIYENFICDEPRYWGAFSNSQLVGTTGLVPMKINSPYGHYNTFLDTDLLVHPLYRNTKIAYELVQRRFSERVTEPQCQNDFYFGIEQNLNQLETCTKLGHRFNIEFPFPLATTLRQVFLTAETSESGLEKNPAKNSNENKDDNSENPAANVGASPNLKVKLVSQLSESEKAQWLKATQPAPFLYPHYDESIWNKLIKADPNCQAIFLQQEGRIQVGAILLSQRLAREFRLTGKNSLLFERLRRKTGEALKAGDELRFGVMGMLIGEDSIGRLTESLVGAAEQRRFHCLVYRTNSAAEQESYFSTDIIDSVRRVFFAFSAEQPGARQILNDIKTRQLKVRMDSLFL